MRCQSRGIRPDWTDRSCGFLTKTEREYLQGDWRGRDKKAEQSKESEIIIRTRHALADFSLLQEYASEGLKQNVIREDVDAEIFREDAFDQMVKGMLRFASDASVDEDFSDYIIELSEEGTISEILDEETFDILAQTQQGNAGPALHQVFKNMGQLAKQHGISKHTAKRAFENGWPD